MNMTIKINGRDLILSPRKAKDLLTLVEAIQDLEQTNTIGMITASQIINDSLKATYIDMMEGFDQLGLIKKFKKLKETKHYAKYYTGASSYLLGLLSAEKLSETCDVILTMEGSKKKEMTPEKENRSEETLQKV